MKSLHYLPHHSSGDLMTIDMLLNLGLSAYIQRNVVKPDTTIDQATIINNVQEVGQAFKTLLQESHALACEREAGKEVTSALNDLGFRTDDEIEELTKRVKYLEQERHELFKLMEKLEAQRDRWASVANKGISILDEIRDIGK